MRLDRMAASIVVVAFAGAIVLAGERPVAREARDVAAVTSPAATAADPVTMRGAALIRRVTAHEIAIAVDVDDMNANTSGDGVVDHVFRFWSDAPFAPLALNLPSADIEYRGNELVIIAADRDLMLSFIVAPAVPQSPDAHAAPATRATYVGFGLNHQMGRNAQRVARIQYGRGGMIADGDIQYPTPPDPTSTGGTSCDAGGRGATSCSISDSTGSCSITCSAGTYACCNRDSFPTHNQSCRCVPN
jgi:hypothetical protein